MSTKKATAIATIDCTLISIKEQGSENEIILDTSNQLTVEPNIDTQEAVPLIIKGVLRAQKPSLSTITGNTLTLTDNVFSPELVMILQGGTMETDADTGAIKSYTPPVAGSSDRGKVFELSAYSSVYDAAGLIVNYEKVTYPNCQGQPVAFGAEDGVFRVNTYTITSAPKQGEAPYKLTYVDELPVVSA